MSQNSNQTDVKFSNEQLELWEEYRNSLYIQKTKSDDLFEKAITFIASGALGLTLTFHDKIVPDDNAEAVVLIAIGWSLLVATLFVNLISHFQSSKSTDKTIDEIDGVLGYEITYEKFKHKLKLRNSLIDNLNKISILLLGLGLLLIIIYVSINIHYGKETKTNTTEQTTEQTEPETNYGKSKGANDSTTSRTIKS